MKVRLSCHISGISTVVVSTVVLGDGLAVFEPGSVTYYVIFEVTSLFLGFLTCKIG